MAAKNTDFQHQCPKIASEVAELKFLWVNASKSQRGELLELARLFARELSPVTGLQTPPRTEKPLFYKASGGVSIH